MASANEERDIALKNALSNLTRLVYEKDMSAGDIEKLVDHMPYQIDLIQCKAGLPQEGRHLRRQG